MAATGRSLPIRPDVSPWICAGLARRARDCSGLVVGKERRLDSGSGVRRTPAQSPQVIPKVFRRAIRTTNGRRNRH
jgi:hypothetical protein